MKYISIHVLISYDTSSSNAQLKWRWILKYSKYGFVGSFRNRQKHNPLNLQVLFISVCYLGNAFTNH